MPSAKRYRLAGIFTVLALLALYYVSYGASNTVDSPFYRRTASALTAQRAAAQQQHDAADQAAERDHAERRERLKKEHDVAMAALPVTTTTTPAIVPGTVSETTAPAIANGAPQNPAQAQLLDVAAEAKAAVGAGQEDSGVAPAGTGDAILKTGDNEFAQELAEILTKAPVVIFSKSYCPHSRDAKHVLLDLYTVVPAPHVVELDQHVHGGGLQRALADTTGRATVPNVLVNGTSIGGGDDILALDRSGKLAALLTTLGGDEITSVVKNPRPDPA